jgi:UDP:flavonoid glycosyltransferase YjiC (YdhE family)
VPRSCAAPTSANALSPPERLRVLFTTSNGTGLGHLTRSMAIARRFADEVEPLFFTLSGAAPVVERMGFAVEYAASYATPASGNDYRWSRRLRGRLRAAIAEAEPDLIVFDGTHPYEALLGALPASVPAIWCRRALWKRGSSRVPLGRAGAFDAVLEPGEVAEAEDLGPTVEVRDRAHRVGPIVLLDRDELLPRAEAEAELGLEPGGVNVLVGLGQGVEVREATARCLRALAGREGVRVAALRSAIAALDHARVPGGVVELRATYPMSRYFAAFDAAVAAAGYNAYHELIALGVPSLFVPMHRETDDQPARARYAAERGLGLGASGPADPALESLLAELLDADRRAEIGSRLTAVEAPRGAAEAAEWLVRLGDRSALDRGGSSQAARSGWRDFRRRWGQFIASVPRTAVRLGRQQLTQPRARTWIVAIGVDRDVVEAVRSLLGRTPDPPQRVLVITDSLQALPELRALGVGIEHVPARESRQAELAGVPYERFVRRRLELIAAERPHPRRTLVP